MKETFYFTHDFNAQNDPKIRKMRRKWKMEGVGVFWCLIEMLAQETERWYLPKDYDELADDLRTTEKCIKSIVEDFDLFVFDQKNFWNRRLDRHFDIMAEKSTIARKNAEKRWKKQDQKMQSECKKNATAYNLHCQSDAIKEKKRKEKKIDTTINGKNVAEETFEIFWKIYPKKIGKAVAKKSWIKLSPGEDICKKIATALQYQMQSDQWQKSSGQYIPNPSTWLNQERWNDEQFKDVDVILNF